MEKKNLIVFYSYSGNTEKIAKMIKDQIDGDIMKVEEVNSYPNEYNDLLKQAKSEIQSKAMPDIINDQINIDDYKNIFIGSPNWWNNIAPPLRTFLRQYNFSVKSIYPFCTHGGGGRGRIFEEIAKESESSDVKNGLEIYSSGCSSAQKDISKWLAAEFK